MAIAKMRLRVQASARRDEFLGIRDGVLLVRVRAAAIEGRANEAVCRMLAKRLHVPRSSVRIARGGRSRDKVVEVDGMDQPTLLDAFAE